MGGEVHHQSYSFMRLQTFSMGILIVRLLTIRRCHLDLLCLGLSLYEYESLLT